MRILLIACLIVVFVLFGTISGLTQDVTTPSAISSRIAELTPPDKDIPDNPIVLADEIRRVNEELDEARKSADRLEKQIKSLTKSKDEVTKTFNDVAALNCDASPANLPALMDQVERLARMLADPIEEETTSPWASVSTRDLRNLAVKDQCERLKGITADPDLLNFVDKEQTAVTELKKETDQLVEALQKRRAALVTNNQAAETKHDIFQYLWVIIGVIGLLSIGTIFVIKTFDPDLQQQWVSSGQVIQFVTVMILLSVIMALGLASILKENTLGTLLGGIAGYVLSQGVGRAAAQAVKEAVRLGTGVTQQTAGPLTPLILTSITPNDGPAGGGTAVTIVGTGFDSVISVIFGGAAAAINNQTSTTVEVTTPAGHPGAVDVIVTNRDGRAITAHDGFTFV